MRQVQPFNHLPMNLVFVRPSEEDVQRDCYTVKKKKVQEDLKDFTISTKRHLQRQKEHSDSARRKKKHSVSAIPKNMHSASADISNLVSDPHSLMFKYFSKRLTCLNPVQSISVLDVSSFPMFPFVCTLCEELHFTSFE